MVEGGVADPATGMVRPLQVKFAHAKDAATRASASAAAAAAAVAAGDGFGAQRAPHGRQGHGHSHGPSRGGGGGGVGAGQGPVGTVFDEPNVYVAGLPKSLTRQGVEAIFAQFGRVSHVKVRPAVLCSAAATSRGDALRRGLQSFPLTRPSLSPSLAPVPLSLSFTSVTHLFCVFRFWPRRRTLWHPAASPS